MSMMFAKQVQIVAGDPIEAAGRRFLPSVLVVTHQRKNAPERKREIYVMRPIAVVEQQGEAVTWHALPDVTQEYLSRMAGIGLGIALVGSVLLFLVWLLRR